MVNEITALIGNLGFPIAMCVYMTVYNGKVIKENTVATNRIVSLIEMLADKVGVDNK